MNIWLVTIGEPLPTEGESRKLRTVMLAKKLIAKGHTVLLFASAFDHLHKKWLYEKDAEIKLSSNLCMFILKGKGYKKNISWSRFLDHRIIARKFKQATSSLPKPDIIIASMPPHDLAYEAVMFANKNNIPVIVDIRDPWPDIFINNVSLLFRSLLKIILRKEFRMARKGMQLADGLVATTSTLLNWGLNYADRKITEQDKVIYLAQNKITQLKNKETEEKWKEAAVILQNKFIVLFVGTISHYHSPLILVEVAKSFMLNEDIHFVIAGNGELYNELENKSRELPNVTLTGFLNQHEIEFWLMHSRVGVCTTPKFTDILPNKTGTYLSAGLPIVSSFQGDMKVMIEKEEIGFYFPPGNSEALVDAITKLSSDKNLYTRFSENAKNAFQKYFNADVVYSDYARHIEYVAANHKPGK